MGKRMTREEFLEAVFSRRYEELKGRELRTVRVRVVGKELSLAQLIGVTDRRVYENLGLHIGTHLGEDHTGQSIGLLHLTPWEATVVAADRGVPVVYLESDGPAKSAFLALADAIAEAADNSLEALSSPNS